VLRTEALPPAKLEAALRRALRQWRWQHLRRTFWQRKGYYLRAGLRNPLRTIEILRGNM
jgi:hypothetical protein